MGHTFHIQKENNKKLFYKVSVLIAMIFIRIQGLKR